LKICLNIFEFKLYKSQIPIIEQALEIAARMLGSDKSRGYCLEMICADFIAGIQVENGSPDSLLSVVLRLVSLGRKTRRPAAGLSRR